MKKEIKSLRSVKVPKQEEFIEINTNIKYIKTYNEQILKKPIYLETTLNDVEIMLKTQKGNNLIYAKVIDNGPEEYSIKEGDILGYLTDYEEENKKTR